ncbi:MAG: aminotransferase class I/II-fold pyridoxal phosphate-dependent enzyme [Legionellales bacterium]|nr:aminotransferase class I/II-fold pyridoxal phosphate-dependent enzyme [Legionellales bacterium]
MSTITLAKRIARVQPSATLAVAARAAELKAAGKDIISLSTGEPDFDTPESIKQAAITAMQAGHTKYTAVDGIAELKQAIIHKFQRDNQLTYAANQILVSSGAKHSLYNLMQALLDAGDEVIIPAPYWVSYPDMVKLADATPVTVTSTIAQDFKITPQQLAQAITPRTKLFILNSPSNPTGKIYSRAELAALADVLLQHPQVITVTDDIYENIMWTQEPFSNLAMVCPELYDRIIVVNGVSKLYAMTGWRIGYAAGAANVIAGMKKMQSQSTSCPTSIAQYAAAAAIGGDQSLTQPMIEAFHQRHDYVYQRLSALTTINVTPADGTFYIFPDCQSLIAQKGLADDVALAEALLNECGIAVVPGTAFGSPNCIRLSFATSMTLLQTALDRLSEFATS